MNDTDKRGSNLVDGTGRGALSFGEREALAAQAKNRRLGDGNLPGDDDAARISMASSDPGGVKQPVFKTWSRSITIR